MSRSDRRPIVVLFDCELGAENEIGLHNDFLKQIYGFEPLVLHLYDPEKSRNASTLLEAWWVNPLAENNILAVLREYEDMSLRAAKEWVETEDFVAHVSRDISTALDQAIKYVDQDDQFDESLRIAVRLIVLDGRFKEDTSYARRVFDELFPNAREAVVDVDGKVLYREDVDHRSLVKEMAINQLEMSIRTYNCLKRAGYNTVGELIAKNVDEIGAIPNFGSHAMDELKAALAKHGLSLREE